MKTKCNFIGAMLLLLVSSHNLQAGGLTIVTHGYYTEGTIDWVWEMREAIAARAANNGSVALYALFVNLDETYPVIDLNLNSDSSLGNATSGESIIYLDWRYDSTINDDHTASVAQAVVNKLLEDVYVLQQPIHLIGHSRGGWLVGEIARGLAERNIWVDQVTFLDPTEITRPGGLSGLNDPRAEPYDNIVFADEYYQRNTQWYGEDLDWVYSKSLTTIFANDSLTNNNHVAVHDWYHGTIDTSATNVDERPIARNEWYNNDSAFGYELSRIGNNANWNVLRYYTRNNGLSEYHGGFSQRETVTRLNANECWPNIMIEIRGSYQVQEGQPIQIDAIYNTPASATIQLLTDDDSNPYTSSSTGREITSFNVSASQSHLSRGTITHDWFPTAADNGKYVYAKIVAGTRTRYYYLPQRVQVTAQLQVTVSASPSGQGLKVKVDGTDYTDSQTFTWGNGTPHTIEAPSPQSGYTWSYWSPAGSGQNFQTITPQANAQYVATFVMSASGGVTITQPNADPYVTANSSVTVAGIADSGASSVTWVNSANSVSGTATGTDSWQFHFYPVDGNNLIQVTANYPSGQKRYDSVLVVKNGAVTTATFYTFEACTVFSGSVPRLGAGGGAVWVGYDVDSRYLNQRPLVKFSGVSLPNGSSVQTAQIKGKPAGSQARGDANLTVYCNRVTSSWTPSTATWGTSYTTTDRSSVLIDKTSTTKFWDVTAIAGLWLSGTANNGVILISASENCGYDNDRYLNAGENEFSLTVTYLPESTPPTVTISSPTASDTYSTSGATISLSGSASDTQNGISSVQWRNEVTGSNGNCSGSTSWSAANIPLVAGVNRIVVTAFDGAGNPASDTITVTYTPSLGSLIVTIDTSEARSDGARWMLTSGSDTNWHSSGDVVSDILVGNYTIGFKDVAGWTTPSIKPKTINQGNNSDSGTYTFNVQPPTGVTATDAIYSDHVRVSWNASSAARWYEVWRNTSNNSGGAQKISSADVMDTNFYDYSATHGQIYYYWVKANNASGTSPMSGSNSGYRALSAPSGLAASDGSYTNKVGATWNSAAGAEGYRIYRHTVNNSGAASLIGDAFGAGFNDTNAAPGTLYYYWVKATNAITSSDFSGVDTGYRMISAPITLNASDGTFTDKVQLTWNSSEGASSYSLWRNASNYSASATNIGIAATTNYNDSNAVAGITYYYWVKASNVVCQSAFSSPNYGHKAIVGAPASPTNTVASDGIYSNMVLVNWSVVTNATAYEIWRNSADDFSLATKISTSDVSTNAFGDATAMPGTTYYYWMKAKNDSGASGFGDPRDSGWRNMLPPDSISATDGAYTDKVRVAWSTVLGATAYTVWRGTNNQSGAAVSIGGDVTNTNYDDTTVENATLYYYWVKAKNASLTSALSMPDSGYSRLIPPFGVSGSDGIFSDKVRVIWSRPAKASAYLIYRHTANDVNTAQILVVTPGTQTSANRAYYDETSATPETTYYYWVKATNTVCDSTFSASDSGWEGVAPSVTSQPQSQTKLPGDPVTFSITGAGSVPLSYQWQKSGVNIAGATASSYTINGVAESDEGAYRCLVTNLCGSTLSAEANLTVIDVGTLAAPTQVRASDGTYTDKVRVTWNAVNGASFYEVWRAAVKNSAAAISLGNATLSSYDDNSSAVRSATMFYYWVKALNSVATSDFSNVDSGFCRMSTDPEIISGQPVVGDYDGDGRADPAVYDLTSGRLFAWLSSAGYFLVNPVTSFQVSVGDLPVAGDFDGDRLADPGVFNFATGSWYIWLSSAGYYRVGPVLCGLDANDIPIPADYDGDQKTDLAVYQASSGGWYVWLSGAGYIKVGPFPFHQSSADIPAPGQFDVGLLADPAVYQQASGAWYIWLSNVGYLRVGPITLRTTDDHLPVPADYDGDGLCDPAAYVPFLGKWRMWMSGSGYALTEIELR